MARKKADEDKLIMPKHLAEIPFFLISLRIYHDHPDGLPYTSSGGTPGFVDLLKTALLSEGVEKVSSSDRSHYTKCAQLVRYFGFVRYVDNKGTGAITEVGERFYSALTTSPRDDEKVFELLFQSLTTLRFGSRTEGVGSQSCYEPMSIFFKAAKQLNGIAANEFGYLIQKLDSELVPFSDVIEDIRKKREDRTPIENLEQTQAHNIQDWTSILFLKYLGFLQATKDSRNVELFSLADSLKTHYEHPLTSMPIFSRGFKRQLFSMWLRLVEREEEKTAKDYCASLAAMSKDIGVKDSAVFEGFFRTLTGHMPEVPVFEVLDLEDFNRVYREVNLFLNMPEGKNPGRFEWARYDECYYYAKAPQCMDHGRLVNACRAYLRFLDWWNSRRPKFQDSGVVPTPGAEGNRHSSLQLIKYGAPGTGKSYDIESEVTNDPETIRTTFHPDSDYASFVGAYKPTMGDDGKIKYTFGEQAFLKAYVNAWKRHDEDKVQYLVIEEINRGNCAQIFGDLFQLLDRNEKGYSAYHVVPDGDLSKRVGELMKKEGVKIDRREPLEFLFPHKGVADRVLSGEWLLLPRNFRIRATMNTSDQSLFPMDSAFKRRWDWEYMPITKNKDEDYKIEIDGEVYDWWKFVEAINDRIFRATDSEDKKLGYFFVKAEKKDGRNVIDADRFLNKVVFYLWNDVFKHSEPDKAFRFKRPNEDKESNNTFQDFFDKETGERNDAMLKNFLANLEVAGTKKIVSGGGAGGSTGGANGKASDGGDGGSVDGEDVAVAPADDADRAPPDTPESGTGNGSVDEG